MYIFQRALFYQFWFIFIFKHLKHLIKIWYTYRRDYDVREEYEGFSQTELFGVMIIQIFSFILKSSLLTCYGHFSISTPGAPETTDWFLSAYFCLLRDFNYDSILLSFQAQPRSFV